MIVVLGDGFGTIASRGHVIVGGHRITGRIGNDSEEARRLDKLIVEEVESPGVDEGCSGGSFAGNRLRRHRDRRVVPDEDLFVEVNNQPDVRENITTED